MTGFPQGFANVARTGLLPLGHFDKTDWFNADIADNDRFHLHGARVRYDRERITADPLTVGPLHGAYLWQSAIHPVEPRYWSFGQIASPSIPGAQSFHPIASKDWEVYPEGRTSQLPRTDALPASTPLGEKFPSNWPMYVGKTYDYEKQECLALPGFAGLVVGEVYNGTGTADRNYSTPIYQPDHRGRITRKQRAQLDSAVALYPLPQPNRSVDPNAPIVHATYGAGIQLGSSFTPNSYSGYGAVVEGDEVGFLSRERFGGPIYGGCPDGKHIHSVQGNKTYGPAHLSTEALFGRAGDCYPVEFDTVPYGNPDTAPFETTASIRPDKQAAHQLPNSNTTYQGLWRIVSTSYFSELRDPLPPPPEDGVPPRSQPPEGDPLPPPGGDGKDEDDKKKKKKRDYDFPPGVRIFVDPDGNIFLFSKTAEPQRRYATGHNTYKRPLVSTPREVAFGGQVWRAYHSAEGSADLRNGSGRLTDEEKWRYDRAPVVMRAEAFGKQNPNGFELTTSHVDGNTRYCGQGEAQGGVVYMPANLGIEHVDYAGDLPAHDTPTAVYWRSNVGVGSPSRDHGSMINGMWLSHDFDTGYSHIQGVDGDGAGTTVMSVFKGTLGFFGATPVSQPAAYTLTDCEGSRALDCSTATASDCAEVLSALISDLQSLGLVG